MSTQQLKQPKSLAPLCFTEAWERFGFYMIQTALVLIITNYFNLPDNTALLMVGTFGALTYISPTIGGYYADKIFGYRYTILMGCILQMLGYICIALLHLPTVIFGLSLVVLGNGFLKANIPSFLGTFYQEDDHRRRSGFTLYYMGMNLGSLVGTLTVGYIQRYFGWNYCYIFAAIGMFVGICVYLWGFKRFAAKGLPVNENLVYKQTAKFILMTVILAIIIVAICYVLLSNPHYGDAILIVAGVLVLIYLFSLSIIAFKAAERKHLLALIILTIFAVVFWAIFFQMFSLVPLFIERMVNHKIFGFDIPTSAFLALEPVFIMVTGWPLAALWKHLHVKKKDPNIMVKFIISLLFMYVSMKILAVSTEHLTTQFLVYPAYIVVFFLFLTLGEMLLSPNFLAAVTELAPKRIAGMMMGIQYMAIAFGSLMAGLLSQIAALPKSKETAVQMTTIYHHAFNVNALICLVCAVAILCFTPFVSRLIRAQH